MEYLGFWIFMSTLAYCVCQVWIIVSTRKRTDKTVNAVLKSVTDALKELEDVITSSRKQPEDAEDEEGKEE